MLIFHFPDHILSIRKVVTAAPTDLRHLIKIIHHPTLRPDRPLSIPKVPPTAEEEALEAFEETSLVQAEEADTEADSRILNGAPVLAAEGANTRQA